MASTRWTKYICNTTCASAVVEWLSVLLQRATVKGSKVSTYIVPNVDRFSNAKLQLKLNTSHYFIEKPAKLTLLMSRSVPAPLVYLLHRSLGSGGSMLERNISLSRFSWLCNCGRCCSFLDQGELCTKDQWNEWLLLSAREPKLDDKYRRLKKAIFNLILERSSRKWFLVM